MTLNLLSNVIGNSNDKTNFPYRLLLTDRQVARLRKVYSNGSAVTIKSTKIQLYEIQQSG